ncbi:MAG: GNAT family N-acetyltransferase [Geminicoccaceae bacterium]
MIEARDITESNIDDLLRLDVRDDQEHLVASNAVTIAQAHYRPHSWVRGLWSGEKAVGLIAMIDLQDADEDDPQNAAYLWRLMIDADHQGNGYGRQAIDLAFEQARRWQRDTLCVHVCEGKGSALELYRRFGLEPTGRIDDGEIFLVGPVPKP